MISKAPVSRASAFAPDAGSISGVAAKQTLDMPMATSAVPAIFIKLFILMLKTPDLDLGAAKTVQVWP